MIQLRIRRSSSCVGVAAEPFFLFLGSSEGDGKWKSKQDASLFVYWKLQTSM